MHALRTSKHAKAAGIKASPRFPKGSKQPKAIPDVMFGKRIIDAKFPCKPPIKMPLNGKHVSDLAKTGRDMLTQKERTTYRKVGVAPGEKQNKVSAMTPKDAQSKKGDCKCKYKTRKT